MKTIIYQVLPRLWGNGKMSCWGADDFAYLKTLGVDYIWYTGIPRHASGKEFVKGDPGCPYSITDWFDTNPYLADNPDERLKEFDALVVRTHGAGLKCIIDFIPNHVARDYHGDIRHHNWFDGDWTDTLKNDWSDPRTYDACLATLRFWASRGVDGFRFDMVELVPAAQMRLLLSSLKAEFPGLLTIAEVYNKENYRTYLDYVGFSLIYDKSGLYDTLRNIICCDGSARALTWNWQSLGELQPRMLNFLENHDEQRIASPEFAGSASRAYAALAFSALFNTASFMLYFGQEAGENAKEGSNGRTSIFNWCEPAAVGRINKFISTGKGLDVTGKKVLRRYKEIMSFAAMPVFRSGRNWDLCYCQGAGFNPDRAFAFLRFDQDEAWLVYCNFSDSQVNTTVNVPSEPLGRELTVPVKVAPWDAAIVKL